jgi:hypothetical protein
LDRRLVRSGNLRQQANHTRTDERMTTTTTATVVPVPPEHGTPTIRWRSWPLLDFRPWSWLLPAGILATGFAVWTMGGGATLTFAAVIGLAAGFWQFMLPVAFETSSLGIRRSALGRTRLVPWHAIRAYQMRPTGVVLYQRPDPSTVDLLRSQFVPYPPDADELLCVVQQFLSHAVELPE